MDEDESELRDMVNDGSLVPRDEIFDMAVKAGGYFAVWGFVAGCLVGLLVGWVLFQS